MDKAIINCTFTNNTGHQNAGVMLLQVAGSVRPTPSVANSILYGNHNLAQLPPGRPYAANLNTDATDATFTGVNANCIGGGYPVGNNISAVPRFLDPDGPDNIPSSSDDNYRLQLNSPCLDAGDSSRIPADAPDLNANGDTLERLPVDLDGMPRRQDIPDAPDVGLGGAPVPDMGCYEAVPLVSVSFWNNPSGGLFGDPANWNPAAVPPINGTAIFDNNSSYTVGFQASTTIDSFEVRNDDITFALSGATLSAAGFPSIIARRTDDLARFTLLGGQASLGSLRLAEASRSTADCSLVGAPGSPAGVNCTSSLVVGTLGSASLSISGGSSASALITTIGEQPGSFGRVSVTGPGSSFSALLLTQVQRGSVGVLDGGRLTTGLLGALFLQDSALTGNGTVTGPVFNFGTVAPGSIDNPGPGAISIGTLTLESGYQQIGTIGGGRNSGSFFVELAEGSNDRIEIAGNAALAGGLFVTKDPGFTPDPAAVLPSPNAYRATILRADSIGQASGMTTVNAGFDVALFPPLPAGRFFQLERADVAGKQEIRVVQAVLTGDVNTGGETSYAAEGNPTDAVLADMNNDGFPDLVLAIPSVSMPPTNGNITILRNSGTTDNVWQGFASGSQTTFDSGGVNPVDLAVADFNDDGLSDLIVVNRGSNSYRVMINTTKSSDSESPIVFSLRPPVSTGSAPGGVAALDYNADARTDAAITLLGTGGNGQVVPLLNLGGPPSAWLGFQPETPVSVGPGPTAIAAGNLERLPGGDPNGPDLVVANSGNPQGTGDTISVLINSGPGAPPFNRFSVPTHIRVGTGPVRILLADLENDKETDILTGLITINQLAASPNSSTTPGGGVPGSLSVMRLLPNGTISPPVTFDVGFSPSSVVAANLDTDSDKDLAVAIRPTAEPGPAVVRVLRNDTPPGADPATTPLSLTPRLPDISTSESSSLIVAGDVDGDTDRDLVIVNADTFQLRPDAGERGGNASRITVVPNTAPAPCIGDFNNDHAVNVADLTLFLGRFGHPAPLGSSAYVADLVRDGEINSLDLVRFLGRLGQPCD